MNNTGLILDNLNSPHDHRLYRFIKKAGEKQVPAGHSGFLNSGVW
jgi:hypothetical protein